MLRAKTSGRVSTGATTWRRSSSKTRLSPSYGFGGTFALTPSLDVVAEYERYPRVANEKDNDIRFLSAGVRYGF